MTHLPAGAVVGLEHRAERVQVGEHHPGQAPDLRLDVPWDTEVQQHQRAAGRAVLDPVRRPSLRDKGIAANPAFDEVLRRALAVDPKERFADVGAMWDALVAAGAQAITGAPAEDPLTRHAAARVGATLRQKWRLDGLLGVGGMAAVYAATHRNGSRGAVKMLHLELSTDQDMRNVTAYLVTLK